MKPDAHLTIPAELLEAARAGEQPALLALIEAVQPHVRRYARHACRSSSDAEDAAQDALWLIYRRIGTLRVLGSFTGWAFAIIRRECLRLARRLGHIESAGALEGMEERLAATPDLDLRLDLAAAIQSLPAHYREIILLRDIQEMTIDEISAQTKLTRESVKARLHRARLLVREYLS
jgi:RNA polymerase sigma-70 factor (ECF subfamily)